MNRCLTYILAAVFFASGTGLAQETTTILESRTSTAPSVDEFPFRVPPFSVEHQVRLILEARIDSPRLAGSNPWIRVAVNGNYELRLSSFQFSSGWSSPSRIGRECLE